MPNTTAIARCHECGQRLAGGSLVESLREQLREAKLGMKQRDGEIERLTALLRETASSRIGTDPHRSPPMPADPRVRRRTYPPRPCEGCHRLMQPTSGRQKRHPACARLERREYARIYATSVRRHRTGRSDGSTPAKPRRAPVAMRLDFLLACREIAAEMRVA